MHVPGIILRSGDTLVNKSILAEKERHYIKKQGVGRKWSRLRRKSVLEGICSLDRVVRKSFTGEVEFAVWMLQRNLNLQAEKNSKCKGSMKGQIFLDMIGYSKEFVFHPKCDGKPSEGFKQKKKK